MRIGLLAATTVAWRAAARLAPSPHLAGCYEGRFTCDGPVRHRHHGPRPSPAAPGYPGDMTTSSEVEFIFEPDPDGGYHAYAPELPGLHTEGDTLDEALVNAQEALDLYIDGLREEGRSLDMGIVRRTLPLPA